MQMKDWKTREPIPLIRSPTRPPIDRTTFQAFSARAFNPSTAPLAARCTAVSVDRDERKGKLPSDHAPVLAVFD